MNVFKLLPVQIILFCSTYILHNQIQAQYYTIPDVAFVSFLQTNYPACMAGNQMDTTCSAIMNETSLDVSSLAIADLTGIKYFSSLQTLQCSDNALTVLSELPDSLIYLIANNNNLTTISELPATLIYLFIDDNPNLQCLPQLPEGLYSTIFNSGTAEFEYGLSFFNTQITCIPNLPGATYNGGAYPICLPGDLINNPAGCASYGGIYGQIFQDTSGNCLYDSPEPWLNSVKMILLDDLGNQIGIGYSAYGTGLYHFQVLQDGDYVVFMDTTSGPNVTICPVPGIDSLVSITGSIPATEVDFGITCSGGTDLSATSILYSGLVFPGEIHEMMAFAGDAYSLLNMNCTSTGGEVIITVYGPVVYDSPALGALIPNIITGNQFTYYISDFSMIDPYSAFNLYLKTDTAAVAGDSVCVTVEINSSTTDTDLSNNIYQDCYLISNSFDPNMKTVYPEKVFPDYSDWITYTIHFQNTGTAPALNILLRDTLDYLLDIYSFEFISSNHAVTTQLYGNNLTFNFENIMLPDSATDPEGSKGYVQYRVKPQSGLPNGTVIENDAYIYFDYNAPILTNTATTSFIYNLSTGINTNEKITPYPNPSSGIFVLTLPENWKKNGTQLVIFNIADEQVMELNVSETELVSLDLSNEKSGIYFVVISNGDQLITTKLVKY